MASANKRTLDDRGLAAGNPRPLLRIDLAFALAPALRHCRQTVRVPVQYDHSVWFGASRWRAAAHQSQPIP